jgi:hypothetical protein
LIVVPRPMLSVPRRYLIVRTTSTAANNGLSTKIKYLAN